MADIAIFRINYKSDFILTLQSDAGWTTPFCIKFWTGAPSKAYYAYYDGMSYTHCTPVEGEPTKLLVQFDDHHLPIGDLKFQIGYHFTVADFPTSIEDEVINQASVIIEVDDAPAQVMLDFNGETAPEIQFALPAYANEAQRIANEEERIAHEQQRIANEGARIAAETIRQQNEEQRIEHETARVDEFAQLKRDSEQATSDANTAANLANEKAQLAADKAALAQAAATLAGDKAQLADDKAALAQAAATLANEKAAFAQQKAEYAQTQGNYANTQGDYAKNQGDYAKEQGNTAKADHVRAEADHAAAADDHQTAAADHITATADHSTAASDHTRADADHTTASSDHSTAESDHTTAASDHTRAESDHTTAASDHETAASDHTRAESDHAAVEVYVDSLGVFDLSKHNAVDGVLATYADLSAALTALNALDSKYKYGGMSFKFVQSSDNKYVQYRLMADEWSTDTEDWVIAEEGVYVENPEFIDVKLDANKRILWAINRKDGTVHFGAGVPPQIIEYIQQKIDKLSLDEYEGIVAFLNGLEEGDKTLQTLLNEKVDKEEGKSLIDAEYASSQSTVDNPEHIEVTTDVKGKIIAGRTPDGAAFENIGFSTPKMSVNGHTMENIEDPEGRNEITIDSEDKVISYRDADGVKHENIGLESKSITTNSLHLTSDGMTEFQQALIESGFNPKMPIDWSDKEELRLPIPRTCAKVNLIVENLPTSKTADYEALLEYSDLDGNYFKKPIILNAQGSSSIQYVEKNLGFDLDDGSEIQFGNWVAQDSFHLKCYYIDVFRGEANICYNYTNEVIKYLNCRANRVLNDNSATTTSNGIGKFNKDFGSSALCQPDGFPIEVYHNGTYYGLFTWNLKKHRKNYQMKKDDYSQALMDGEIHSGSFFGGTINWRLFELRNPKTLYLMDGVTKYDGENPQEIISPTMIVEGQEVPNPNYDPNNSNHVKTYQTKAMLEELSQVVPTLNSMTIDTPEGLQAAQNVFEAHFDKEMVICYFILSNVVFHPDGFAKNWIWTVYNGMAAPTFYDMDTMFGRHWTGGKMWPGYNTNSILGNDVSQPCGQAYRLYQTEIEAIYADLRAKKYIDVDYIISFFNDWLNRQTREAVERNIKKWTAIPSYRENGGSYPPPLSYDASVQNEGMYDSIGRVKKWLEARIPALDTFFNYNQN